MKIQDHLSYSAECLAQLTGHLHAMNDPHLARDRRSLAWVIERLRAAPKFLVPENGRVIDGDSSMRSFDHARLPFPVVALEYAVGEGTLGPNEQPSPKRIALVWQDDAHLPLVYKGALGGESAAEQTGRKIFVLPLYYSSREKMWLFSPAMTAVNLECEPQRVSAEEYASEGGSNEVVVDYLRNRDCIDPRSKAMWTLDSEMVVLFPMPISLMMQNGMSMAQIQGTLQADNNDEVGAALSFAAVMGCANVETQRLDPPAALNKKRLASGKEPFDPVHVLWVRGSALEGRAAAHTASASHAGSRASPRMHLRRGHIRVLADRNVWVNHAIVGAHQAGHGDPGAGVDRVYDVRRR